MPDIGADPSFDAGLPRNVVLVGFMGCGKSTLGRLLASRLEWTFVDTDRIIETTTGKSISDIFASDGESLFRKLESDALVSVCSGVRQVIATGGGAVIRPENLDAIREAGFVVWLTARADVIVSRTARRRGRRPLLETDEDPLVRVHRFLGERGPLYRAIADGIVDTSDRPPRMMANELERLVRNRKARLGSASVGGLHT